MTSPRKPQSIEAECPDCGSCFLYYPHGDQKPRSPVQHRRFMLMCQLAYKAWPEHKRKWGSWTEMRYWLTMKAHPSYRVVKRRISLEGMDKPQAMFIARAAFAAADDYLVPQLEGNELVVYGPKSVSYLKMGHREFNALNTMVQDVIKEESGLDVDQLIADWSRLKQNSAHRAGDVKPKYIEKPDFETKESISGSTSG